MNQYAALWGLGMFTIWGIKFSFYMHRTDPMRYSFAVKALMFLGADGTTAAKSVLCLLSEMALGSVYVNSLPMPYGMLGELPKDSFLALFFGAASETVAPFLIDLIVSWFKPRS